MFFHLQYIHLFRPFLKYRPSASPLPPHVSPRRICTAHAAAISKLMRLYKRCYNLRQICNIAVYMTHSACTIHLLNLPDKTARRDMIHGVKHLEEIAHDWLCARRTLSILSVLARKWQCSVPDEAAAVLRRTDELYGSYSTSDVPTPRSSASPQAGLDEALGKSNANSPREYSPMSHYVRGHVAAAAAASASSCFTSRSMLRPGGLDGTTEMDVYAAPTTTEPILPAWTTGDATTTTISANANPLLAPGSLAPAPPPLPLDMHVNGQSWIMQDCARWQQNFEAWDLGAGAGVEGVYCFAQELKTNEAPEEAALSGPVLNDLQWYAALE
ncbi:hypothetical protein CDD81_4247 [Ophiocordyceps australis]|uniref:Transcription factor domain-containing protein n=1 Tax=Ophiocordyceps australis TaxID=1399860 RepID=A0A2C5YAA0_9HYPO|nr:hypothetical protein CDD81_4247 [Ophiocordyceps australis]